MPGLELALESPTSRLVLDNRRVGIGRLPTNQFVLDDPQVSALHAEVIPTAYGCLLIDLGGRNGTFVNEYRLIPDVPYTLRSGDKIRVGQTMLRFLRQCSIRESDKGPQISLCYILPESTPALQSNRAGDEPEALRR